MQSATTNTLNQTNSQEDPRPRFGIGHVPLVVDDVARATEFYTRIGMRPVVDMGRAAILELRGGTHLIVREGRPEGEVLDLIVGDIDDAHTRLAAAGADPGPITRGHPHDRFTATDPAGNLLAISSDHSIGIV